MLLRLSPNRAALVWESDCSGPDQISYGPDGALFTGLQVMPRQIDYQLSGGKEQKSAFVSKLWLDNLTADTTYSYMVADAESKTETFTFHTPAANVKEITFAIYGDCQMKPRIHRKIVELLKNLKPDFILITGDLVNNTTDYPMWSETFFGPLKGLAESIPVYAARGNHDVCTQDYFEKLVVPPGQTSNFGFDFGPAHFYCADQFSAPPQEVLKQICSDLSASAATWKYAAYHMPSINFGGHLSAWAWPYALPKLSMAGADFVHCGHSHQYERFRPISIGTGTFEKTGAFTTFITSGGAGGPLYPVTQTSYHAFAKSINHFCLYHINGNSLSMQAIDINGVTIDHFEITKTNGVPDSAYLATAVPLAAANLHQSLLNTSPMPLASLPDANSPFTVKYELLPGLSCPASITFSIRGPSDIYKLPKPVTVNLPSQGEKIVVELSVTASKGLSSAGFSAGSCVPLQPGLELDCAYETAGIKEKVTHPIMVLLPAGK